MQKPFKFNRELILASFAKSEENNEAKKADYYKNQNAGLKGWINRNKFKSK
jgi:hypothetical protein